MTMTQERNEKITSLIESVVRDHCRIYDTTFEVNEDGIVVSHNEEPLYLVGIEFSESEFYVSFEDSKSAYIAIKSDDIIISKEKIVSSAQNSFLSKIVDIRKKLSVVEIIVDIGVEVHADITYKSLTELNLLRNQNIWLTFKSSSVLVFKH